MALYSLPLCFSSAERPFDSFCKVHNVRNLGLACTKPPQGRARWTLRLLAEQMVELELVESISHDTVDKVLKKTNLSLT